MPEDLCACDQSEAPDLAAWKREAGEAAPLDAAATKGPWRVSTQCHDERPHTEEVCDLVNGVWVVTDKRLRLCRDDAAFIAAARAGWPRDAARVGVLCERVALLERLLAQALDGWEDQAAMPTDEPARLRALAAGGAEKEPSR